MPAGEPLIAWLTTWVMTSRPHASADAYPSVAQQHADAITALLQTEGVSAETEVILTLPPNTTPSGVTPR